MASLGPALAITLRHEGGWSNDPNDAGGETIWGLDKATDSQWPGWAAVDQARANGMPTADLASNLWPQLQASVTAWYAANYWNPIQGSQIQNQALANVLFDCDVVCGVGAAGKLIQAAINDLGQSPPLTVDGQIGPATLAAINAVPMGEAVIQFVNRWVLHCCAIVAANPSQSEFLVGWVRRALGMN